MSHKDHIGILRVSLKRGCRTLVSRKMYLFAIVLIPLFSVFFFDSILSRGVSNRIPSAVVDLDQSPMSRAITRSLNAEQTVDVTYKAESYAAAMDAIRKGDIYGFFVIPGNFEQDVYAGRRPTLTYYSNLTYYVPGTYVFKGFKQASVSATSAVIRDAALSKGLPPDMVNSLVQPFNLQLNELHNPWLNYSYYLGPSFVYGILQLMIFLVTIFSITCEIKNDTSRQWLDKAGGSITVALFGKLVPMTVMFTIVGWACMAFQFGFRHYPMNGSLAEMMLAMFMFVVASQSFGVFVASLLPNPRLALAIGALTGILSFSIAAISFPEASMYGAVAIFSYIVPMRYLFLIHVDNALNGWDFYYSQNWFVALCVFLPVAMTMIWNLKRACKKPVYVP